ncbi:MAG: hypothetical protein L0219_01525 [Phycisphaerales bacterium]|nr:hypothetical protein [Phycisphaerales bacterium]
MEPGDRGGSSPDRSPNDDRSDAMNPTSDAYAADQENRASQRDDDDDDDDYPEMEHMDDWDDS